MTKLTVGSYFTGVGGLELGFSSDFDVKYHSEIDKYCNAVLEYKYPNIPNLGDITEIQTAPYTDIICGGTSCQNFSIQGDRRGLKGNKSRLFLDFIRVCKANQPKYIIWENVVGVLNCNNGKDFEEIKRCFDEAGYNVEHSVFNAKEFAGTIQQRKRVILLATRKDLNQIRFNSSIPSLKLNKKMQDIEKRLVGVSKSHREKHIDVRLNHGVANTLVTGWGCSGISTKNYINENGTLRDLTPEECELLMTWPEKFTKNGIFNGTVKEIPAKERYKMCGNGVVSNLITIIGTRILGKI